MSLQQWEEEYSLLLAKHRELGDLDVQPEGREFRRHPRLRIQKEAIWVNVDAKCEVIDCSISGIAFYSSFLFKPDRIVRLVLGKAFAIEATVLAAAMVETDATFLEYQYRVQCEFLDQLQGKQMLVTITELDSTVALTTFFS